jgi:signal transduction histidine kinase/ActR/RegA family two-component response regulator
MVPSDGKTAHSTQGTRAPEGAADAKPEVSSEALQRWQNLVNVLAELLCVPAGLIMRVRESQIEVLVSSTREGNPYHAGDGEHLGCGLYCETVMAKRSELLVPNALSDPAWAENPDVRLNMISYLGLPLAWPDGEVFGTICVLDNKENSYSDLYRRLLCSFRDQIDADLRLLTQVQEVRSSKELLERLNAELEDKVRDRTTDLMLANQQLANETEELRSVHETLQSSERGARLVKDVAVAANEATSRDEALQVALDRICEYTHWPVGRVYKLEDGELQPTNIRCFDSTEQTALAIHAGLPERVLADGKPHWVEDVVRDADSPRSHGGIDSRVRGAFAFPVLVGGEVVAVLEFYSFRVEHPDDPLLVCMDQIGMQIGAAIQRIRAAKEKGVLERELYKGLKLQALGTLSSGIAHDFNNILQAIYGFLDLAQEDHPAFDMERCLDGVRSAATRAHDLVQQILGFSRPSSAGLERVDVRRAVEETVTLLRASIPSTIDVAMQVDDDCGHVLADAGKIHQLIMNLGVNSFRSIEGETGRIDITAARTRLLERREGVAGEIPPGDYVLLTVEDNGCGMNSQTLENIFDPFFTTRDVGEGTGLGLALVYGVMRGLGGGIQVESEVGLGTSFQIYLPEASTEAVPASQHKRPEVLTGARVLFVDDEEILVHLGVMRLQSLGCVVEGVEGSPEALELFLTDPSAFDIVILDQNMPEMTGSTLAARIHAVRSDLPMILSSGLGATLAMEDLEDTGIRSILCKPHSGEELADAVIEALRGAASS